MNKHKDYISLIICGEAGQGIQTVELLLTRIFKASGFNVYATKEYMSRVRGGSNSVEICISSRKVRAPVNYIDIAVLLDKEALGHVKNRLSESTIVLGEKDVIGPSPRKILDMPFLKEANEIGSKIYANIIAVGVISGILGIEEKNAIECVRSKFLNKSKDIIEHNSKAVQKGYNLAQNLVSSNTIPNDKFLISRGKATLKDEIICNGAEAIGIGALAGGCSFVSSYPMSPSTGVLVFLSKEAAKFNVIAEQAEDEISAINMAIGAWYAGGRALVTTSGGGFALMEEGVSLAAMLEVPIVVHVAQRPGPATGLPTRTEQGDLELVLYSGHGEFPRVIFAPGSVEDAFFCAHRAFHIADKYQIPAFILTDQYLMDSYYNCLPFTVPKEDSKNQIIKTDKNYKRYRITENGLSPRGIPGYGDGLVLVDSDEHDENGRITEDMNVRTKMVEKRLRKFTLINKDIIPPKLIGNPNYSTLLISWGSTFHIVKEAIDQLKRDDIALLHFNQVFPLHKDVATYLKKAKKTIIIENNATSQFGKLIKLYTGIEINEKILKYSGLSFFVDELVERLSNVVRRELVS